MKTAFAMKLLEGFATWPVTTAGDSALQALFNRQAGPPVMRAVRNLGLMPAIIGSMSGVAGRQAMAAGASIARGRPVRRAR